MARLLDQPKTIAALTKGLPRGRLHRRPAKGEWSMNDVLAHLRSCADVWGAYMARIAAEDRPTIRAVNPTTWIQSTDYPEVDFTTSLRAFTRQRARLLSFLGTLAEGDWSRTALVTGAGRPRERTLFEYAQWLADHERSHVKHIARQLTASQPEERTGRGQVGSGRQRVQSRSKGGSRLMSRRATRSPSAR